MYKVLSLTVLLLMSTGNLVFADKIGDPVEDTKWRLKSIGLNAQIADPRYLSSFGEEYFQRNKQWNYAGAFDLTFEGTRLSFNRNRYLITPMGIGSQISWGRANSDREIRSTIMVQEFEESVRYSTYFSRGDTAFSASHSFEDNYVYTRITGDFYQPLIQLFYNTFRLYGIGAVETGFSLRNSIYHGRSESVRIPATDEIIREDQESTHYSRIPQKIFLGFHLAGGAEIIVRSQWIKGDPVLGLAMEYGWGVGVQHSFPIATGVKRKQYIQVSARYFLK